MPPTTHRLANGGVIRVWRGVLTGEDQVESSQEFLSVAGLVDAKYSIVDYRRVTAHNIRPIDAHRISELLRPLGPIRIVAIAPQDILFGFARIVDLTRAENTPWRFHVARTVDEALEWLEEELPDLDFAEARQMLESEAPKQ